MRLILVFMIFVVGLFLTACEAKSDKNVDVEPIKSNTEDKGFIGYVVKIEEGRILVVSSDVKDFSSSGGQNNYYSAIWFSAAPQGIDVGMKVEVWAEGGQVLESYPAQGKAERISVISSSRTEAHLSEAEAVKKAISSLEIEQDHFTVVKEVLYDHTASVWKVSILNDRRDAIIHIQVPDGN